MGRSLSCVLLEVVEVVEERIAAAVRDGNLPDDQAFGAAAGMTLPMMDWTSDASAVAAKPR